MAPKILGTSGETTISPPSAHSCVPRGVANLGYAFDQVSGFSLWVAPWCEMALTRVELNRGSTSF